MSEVGDKCTLDSLKRFENISGAGETAQWAKSLPGKCEDQNLNPQNPQKSWADVISSTLVRERQGIP